VLGACDQVLEAELRGVLLRDDDYASAGTPVCDYEDPQARKALIDALATDAHAILGVVDGRKPRLLLGRLLWCWRRSSGRTSTGTPAGGFGSPEGSRRIV